MAPVGAMGNSQASRDKSPFGLSVPRGRHAQLHGTQPPSANRAQRATAIKLGGSRGGGRRGRLWVLSPRALSSPCPMSSKQPYPTAHPRQTPQGHVRRGRMNRADLHTGHSQGCPRCFPAVSLYLSRAGVMERKAVPVPLPQRPTLPPPPPSTRSSSRPVLCDLRQVTPQVSGVSRR